jgi:hypothetical protein
MLSQLVLGNMDNCVPRFNDNVLNQLRNRQSDKGEDELLCLGRVLCHMMIPSSALHEIKQVAVSGNLLSSTVVRKSFQLIAMLSLPSVSRRYSPSLRYLTVELLRPHTSIIKKLSQVKEILQQLQQRPRDQCTVCTRVPVAFQSSSRRKDSADSSGPSLPLTSAEMAQVILKKYVPIPPPNVRNIFLRSPCLPVSSSNSPNNVYSVV